MLVDESLIIDHSTENKPVGEFGLGRIASFDPRDKKFLMSAPPATQIEIRSRHWITGPVMNQGDKPHCVAYAGQQFLRTAPVVNKYYKTPQELYTACQRNDEWEGESPDYDGTSITALFKVFRDAGYVKEWQNAFDLDTVVRHVLAVGPVVFGFNWFDSMFATDQFGFIKPVGNIVGGHAILAKGVNLDTVCPDGSRGALRLVNSWGREWGDDGKCWLSFTDAAYLIAGQGQSITAKELRFRARVEG